VFLSSAEVKNVWSYAPLLPYAFHSMPTDIFTFTLSKVRTAGSHLGLCVHGRQNTCLPNLIAEIFGTRRKY
jgi:hypothetical protein